MPLLQPNGSTKSFRVTFSSSKRFEHTGEHHPPALSTGKCATWRLGQVRPELFEVLRNPPMHLGYDQKPLTGRKKKNTKSDFVRLGEGGGLLMIPVSLLHSGSR